MRALQTKHKDVLYRSRTEARWAERAWAKFIAARDAALNAAAGSTPDPTTLNIGGGR